MSVVELGRITTPDTLDGDKEELKPLKSIFTLRPCACGANTGYVTIGHVVCAWREGDSSLEVIAKSTSGEVVDAPVGAVLWEQLRGLPKCWNKLDS